VAIVSTGRVPGPGREQLKIGRLDAPRLADGADDVSFDRAEHMGIGVRGQDLRPAVAERLAECEQQGQ
jgi:hypothetical protein